MDWSLFIGFCSVIFLIFLYKSISVYKLYHNTFYEHLYSNFLEYYIKFKYKKNLSKSSWLNQEIGFHRIIFNSYLDQDKKVQSQFVTVFHKKGINIFSISSQTGIITGKQKDSYFRTEKNGKNYRFPNPCLPCETHKQYVENLVNIPCHISLLFPSDANVENVNCTIQISDYSHFLSILNSNTLDLSDDDILSLFNTCGRRTEDENR